VLFAKTLIMYTDPVVQSELHDPSMKYKCYAFTLYIIEYEKTFREIAGGEEKLPRHMLSDYFRECGLHPTQGDIDKAMQDVFHGNEPLFNFGLCCLQLDRG
jgi:hypothetical protein